MVTTLSPNARDTPTRPMPTWGKPAAITALPHPANVSQNVPIASAAYFFGSISGLPDLFLLVETSPAKGFRFPKIGVVRERQSCQFPWLYQPEKPVSQVDIVAFV